jgi:cyclic-di-GMP-binding protein
MPSFDVVSEIDEQELKNAIDQAQREVANRFDFKDTNSEIDLARDKITLHSASEDRIRALRQVIEEKLVKRGLSLKILDFGKIEEATRGSARQVATLQAGIASDKAKEINKFLKDKLPKVVSGSTQGDLVRISGKKRDDLQTAIAALKAEDFGIALQFKNFRD